MSILDYPKEAVIERLHDLVPQLDYVEHTPDDHYKVFRKNGKYKVCKDIEALYRYCGWIITHKSLLK